MTAAPLSITAASFNSWPSLIIWPRIGTSCTTDQSYRPDWEHDAGQIEPAVRPEPVGELQARNRRICGRG